MLADHRSAWVSRASLAVLLCGLLLVVHVSPAAARVLRVGPDFELEVPSAAAKVAKDGDTVEIAAGEYRGDVAVWRQSGLRLRGVGGRPHLRAAGRAAEGKAIWVIKGDDVVVENIEMSGTRVSGFAGAGIRAEGGNLFRNEGSRAAFARNFAENVEAVLSNNVLRCDVTPLEGRGRVR